MALPWESQTIRDIGNLWAKAKKDNASSSDLDFIQGQAQNERAKLGYTLDASGNAVALPGYVAADASGTSFVKAMPAPAQNPNNDILSAIEVARQGKIAARQATLQDLKNKTMGQISQERSATKTGYYNARNDVNTSAKVAAQKLGELMAAKGYSVGSQSQRELGMNVALQGNVGSLKAGEQAANADMNRRESDAISAYDTGLVQAQSDADTWAAEKKLSELGILRDYAREDARNLVNDTGMLPNGQLTQAGQINQQTIESNKINNQIDQIKLSALPQQLKDEAEITRQQLQKGEIDIQTAQVKLKELTDPNSLTNQLARANLYGQNMQNSAAKLSLDSLPEKLKQEAIILAQQVTAGDIDNQTAQAKLDALLNPVAELPLNLKDYYSRVTKMLDATNADGGKLYTDQKVWQYILNLPITEQEQEYLLSAAGFSLDDILQSTTTPQDKGYMGG